MAVDFQHKDYKKRIDTWKMVDNVVNKEELEQYLRVLNSEDISPENNERNEFYKEFAIFYNFTGFTLSGLIGEVYAKSPSVNLPATLDYLNESADGKGKSIQQMSQETTREVTKKARSGLYVSYPDIGRAVSAQDVARGVRATISHIDAKRIINWREGMVDGVSKLTLVVFTSTKEIIDDDGFGVEEKDTWRELSLKDGIFYDVTWWKDEEEWVFREEVPLDGRGVPFTEIPFCFVGSQDNDPSVDTVDISDLADINLGHYRNSADWEDSTFYIGQSQPWMSGIDDAHIKLIRKHGLYSGSRKVMPVPAGETYGYATPDPNPLARVAMQDKMELAKGLGARFIQPGTVAKTAAQALGEAKVAHSILGLIAKNVSEAYTRAVGFVGQYMDADTNDATFELNSEFDAGTDDAEMINAKVTTWMQGGIPLDDHFNNMKKAGLVAHDKKFEDFQNEIDAERGNI